MITTTLARYKAYKESGVDWLGQVPAHWSVKRLKDLVQIKTGSKDTIDSIEDGEYPFFVRSQTIERINTYTFDGEAILTAGDGVGVGKVFHHYVGKFDYHQRVYKISHFKRINGKYLYYFMKENFYKEALRLNAKATVDSLRLPMFRNFPVAFGSKDEQQAIVEYLDARVTAIDHRVDLLTKKAAKYRQLKQSLINETVSRGLDRYVAMKDSGVEWMGPVPAHWQSLRVNDVSKEQKRRNVGLVEKNLLSLSYGNIVRKDIDTSFGLLPESFETYQIVHPGDIILRLTDLQNDWRSLRVGLVKERGIITSAYLCLRLLKQLYPPFAYYLLHVYDIRKVFYRLGGGLRQSMKWEDVKVLPFFCPPLPEQHAIADYLDDKTTQMDRIVETINAQIEALRELRKALVNDVVTGKIRVA